jgi:2'-5' RNA ligase
MGFTLIPPSSLIHRILYFLRPPVEIAEQIVETAVRDWRKYGVAGALVPAHRLHLTVGHVKDFNQHPEELIPKFLEAGENLAFSFSPFWLALERLRSFGIDDNRPLVLSGGIALRGVNAIKRNLLTSLRDVGISYARPLKSAAHMTLQYKNYLIVDRPIDPISWRANELILVESLVGLGVHNELGRWPLKGAEQLSLAL